MEYLHIDGSYAGKYENHNSLEDFMIEKGYTVRAKVTDDKWQAFDYIFVKKGFNEHILLPNIHTTDGEIPDIK